MSTAKSNILKQPFGAVSCEEEIKILKEDYQDFYFSKGRFNSDSLKLETYLIIGRRGSGKTSLSKYFEFQKHIKAPRTIDVDEPEVYGDVIYDIARKAGVYKTAEVSIMRIAKLWEIVMWKLIFNEYQELDPLIAAASILADKKLNPIRIVVDILKNLLSKLLQDDEGEIVDEIENLLTSETFISAKDAVLGLTKRIPVIVAMDTLERYEKENDLLMRATAGLIICSKKFNSDYAHLGIHVKTFMAAEIFPHIRTSVIPNTSKHIQNPLYLHWKPKDLIHLACWRFYNYLLHSNQLPNDIQSNIDWNNFPSILKQVWNPFFGEMVVNGGKRSERSFPYILRHTQLRPRQLVILCNAMTTRAKESNVFPYFHKISIASVIKEAEHALAEEVLNSYEKIYPQVSRIIDSLRRSDMLFEGKYLDKLAHTTKEAWSLGAYSSYNFRNLVAELGIVGVVRSKDDRKGIIAADFEYAISDTISIKNDDLCVIHPMFYSKLQTKINSKYIVYPFPDHEDFEALDF